MCDLSDRETSAANTGKHVYAVLLGFSSSSNEEPFDPSLFLVFKINVTII